VAICAGNSVRVNLEAFAEAAAGGAPHSLPSGEILATVEAFEAIAGAAKSDGRVRDA
jgi:predicted dehydrogenase